MKSKLLRNAGKVLLPVARKAAENAYCPYSGIRVGAAVLAASGNVYSGCNIENASYGLTNCAERVAVQHAVAAGERKLLAVAIFSPDIKAITPCGACRQVLAEFSGPGTLVFLGSGRKRKLSELLPESFALK
jgi:cytidine deaminase